MPSIPKEIEARLQSHLTAIAKIFRVPRITLIVRGQTPEEGANARGDLVITNDNPIFVEAALRARMVERAQILVGTPVQMDVFEKEPTPGGLAPHVQDGGDPRDYQPRRGRK